MLLVTIFQLCALCFIANAADTPKEEWGGRLAYVAIAGVFLHLANSMNREMLRHERLGNPPRREN